MSDHNRPGAPPPGSPLAPILVHIVDPDLGLTATLSPARAQAIGAADRSRRHDVASCVDPSCGMCGALLCDDDQIDHLRGCTSLSCQHRHSAHVVALVHARAAVARAVEARQEAEKLVAEVGLLGARPSSASTSTAPPTVAGLPAPPPPPTVAGLPAPTAVLVSAALSTAWTFLVGLRAGARLAGVEVVGLEDVFAILRMAQAALGSPGMPGTSPPSPPE